MALAQPEQLQALEPFLRRALERAGPLRNEPRPP